MGTRGLSDVEPGHPWIGETYFKGLSQPMPRRWTITLEGIQALSRERSQLKENATTCRNGVLLEVTINGVGAETIPAVKLLGHCFQSGSKRSNVMGWPVYYKR
jgi:hypothetical protein